MASSVTVELYVRRKGADPEAVTAFLAARKLTGVGADLSDLGREVLWILDVEAEDEAAARAVVRRIVNETTVLLNPNQDAYTFDDSHFTGRYGADGASWTRLTVWDLEEAGRDESVLVTLRDLYLFREVVDVKRYRVWTGRLDVDTASKARQIGASMAFWEDLGRGLLVNPHREGYEVASGKGGPQLGA